MKYKRLFLWFCLLNLSGLSGQDKSWSLGPAFSADLCHRFIKSNGDPGKSIKNSRDGVENMKLGYTTGLMVKKNLGNIGFLETGLLYSNKGFGAILQVIFGDQLDSAFIADGTSSAAVQYHFKYMDIPLKMNLTMTRFENMNMFLFAGVNVNYLVEQKTVMHIRKNSQPDTKHIIYNTDEWNRGNISPMFGVGMERRLNENLHFQLESVMKYGIIPIEESDHIETRLWTFGVNAVLYYRL